MAASVDAIFDAFGGVTALAERIKVPVTTAHAWKRAGKIPHWRLTEVERAASEDGIAIAAASKPKRRAA